VNDETRIVTSPSVDVSDAESVLREVEAVLAARGCALIHTHDATVLCKVTGLNEGVHIAKVFEIKPGIIKAKLAWRGLIDARIQH